MYFARDKSDLPAKEQLLQMPGLAILQQMLAGTLPVSPVDRAMGFRLHSVAEGRVVFRGAPGFDMTNPTGGVHGGWYGTVLDSAMAASVLTKVARGSFNTTLEYKINIIRAIPLDMEVDCIGTVDHAGRSTAVARGEIRGLADNRLYATGTTTCMIMDMSKP